MTGSGNFIDSRTTDVVLLADRVARRDVLEADGRRDVARPDLLDLLALVRVHLEEAADPLVRLLRRVVDARPRVEVPRVDPEEGQLPDERVGHDLEDEAGKRGVVLRLERDLLAVLVEALRRRDVERGREVVADRVEELLHALVLEGRAADDGVQPPGDGRLAEGRANLVGRRGVPLHPLVHDRVVHLGDRLDEPLPVLVEHRLVVGRDAGRHELGAERVVLEVVGLPLDEVDDPLERLGRAPWDLDRGRPGGELRDHHVDALLEVGADAVHLVDEGDPGDPVAVRLPPDGLGLRLDAGDGVEYRDGPVQDAKRALHLGREVDVPRRVDDVDPDPLPVAGRRGGRDRDAALLLLDHPVHRRGPVVDLADLVVDPGVVEDTLRRRRLAGVDVGHDADVPAHFEGVISRHIESVPIRVRLRRRTHRFCIWLASAFAKRSGGCFSPALKPEVPHAVGRGPGFSAGPVRALRAGRFPSSRRTWVQAYQR